MKTLIKNGIVINPRTDFCQKADVLIENGWVSAIGTIPEMEDMRTVDAEGCLVTPGLVDIHVHFRDPGFTEKETIRTGSEAAAAGGFTSVVCMPNTRPAVHSPDVLQYIHETAEKEGIVRVYSSAAITKDLRGEEMTDFDALRAAGAVTFTDDGKTVMDPNILYQAFQKAAELDVPISSHCEDHHLVTRGAINRGKVSEKLGDYGIPKLGEESIVARDILFAEETGAHVHIQHVTTRRAVQLIREAKQRGVKVTCEAAPHHFTITDEIILQKGTLGKVNPPLRTRDDVRAIVEGLQDGTIDAIATDHAPHTSEEKNRSLEEAPFGLIGLETCVGLALTTLYHRGKLSLPEVISKLSLKPAKIMNLPHGRLEVGEKADLAIIDPHDEWTVDPEDFRSKSRNTPFAGFSLKGRVLFTFVDGKEVFRLEKGR